MLKTRVRDSCAIDLKNAAGDGVRTSSGATSSGHLPISHAPMLPREVASSEVSLVATNVVNNTSANPTSLVMPDGCEATRVDRKPRSERWQQLSNAIAALATAKRARSKRSSVVIVTEGPVDRPVSVSEIRLQDARVGRSACSSTEVNDTHLLPLQHASTRSDVETVEDDGRREVPFDVGTFLCAPKKTTSHCRTANPMRPLWADDREARMVRQKLKTDEKQRLNELFTWVEKIESVNVVDQRSSTDPLAIVATSSGRSEASAGGSACAGDDGIKSEMSSRKPDKTPSWIANFDLDEIYCSGFAKRTGEDEMSVVRGTPGVEVEQQSSDLFTRTVEGEPAESKPLVDVIEMETIGKNSTMSVARLNDIPSVVGSRDSVGISPCATRSESTNGYSTDHTDLASYKTDEREFDEMLRAERLSNTFERIAMAKRMNASNETEPLCVIIREGWIDLPPMVLFNN